MSVETAVVRSVQELLHNVLEHARARHVSIDISFEDERLRVAVCDDGRGLAVQRRESSVDCSGHGLIGVRERLAAVGGRLNLIEIGRGTCAEVSVPH